MGGMPMPGDWTMSMAWMRMPGQTWPGAAASFLGMWLVMMVAMMLPSLIPALRRYRRAVGGTETTRLDRLTALVGVAYFLVWTALGMLCLRWARDRDAGDAAAGTGARRPARQRRRRPDCRRAAVHGVEGATSCVLP